MNIPIKIASVDQQLNGIGVKIDVVNSEVVNKILINSGDSKIVEDIGVYEFYSDEKSYFLKHSLNGKERLVIVNKITFETEVKE